MCMVDDQYCGVSLQLFSDTFGYLEWNGVLEKLFQGMTLESYITPKLKLLSRFGECTIQPSCFQLFLSPKFSISSYVN